MQRTVSRPRRLSASMTIENDSVKKGVVICYSSPTPFKDKQGNSVTSGQLAKCSAVGNVAPCLVSTTVSDGNLVVDLSVLPGDPRFWGGPELSAFTPTTGVVGTKVTISGGPFKDVTKVEFDGVPTEFKAKASGTSSYHVSSRWSEDLGQ